MGLSHSRTTNLVEFLVNKRRIEWEESSSDRFHLSIATKNVSQHGLAKAAVRLHLSSIENENQMAN